MKHQYRAPVWELRQAQLYYADCRTWLRKQPEKSIHAVVTDPPYGLVEFNKTEQAKLRAGRGGNWRIPPSFDGNTRAPLPRFTTLSKADLAALERFFLSWARALRPSLVPGAHVVVASNTYLSSHVAHALFKSGLECRGTIARQVMTMRGGDRPKGAEDEFPNINVSPRSTWEPWLVYREPISERTVAENLRKWKTGALKRQSSSRPFMDTIKSGTARKAERDIADHPSLKPQAFLRQIVKAVLPMDEGTILDPFAGSGSTLAAALATGHDSIGIEIDRKYLEIAMGAIPALAALKIRAPSKRRSAPSRSSRPAPKG